MSIYNSVKKFLKNLLSEDFLSKNELLFRKVYYQLYRGSKFRCKVCNKGLRKFIILSDGDHLCPYCGSLARNRRLWELLTNGLLKERMSVLHFSPSRSLFRNLDKMPGIQYVGTDYCGSFLAHKKLDITSIDEPDETYDLIICYHILEHIENDSQAMNELHRILKLSGKCIIQTPFKKGDIYEDLTIQTPEARLKHFGQEDHVRIYSVEGLKVRLEQCGFKVEVLSFNNKPENPSGYTHNEQILIAQKLK